MWSHWKNLFSNVCFLATLCTPINAAESLSSNQDNWAPLDLDPQSLNTLLAEVNLNGPRVLNQEFTPYRAQGVLEGCGFSYEVLLKDWAYRSNQPAIVYGSIVFFKYPDRVPFLSLRIGLKDIEQRENALWQKDSAVNFAYLRHEQESTAGEEQQIVDGENGVKNFAYTDPEFEKMTWLLIGDFLTVGFNRQPSGSDLEFNIPVMFTKVWQELGGCFKELSGQ
jgi:hypothetical protein